MATTIPKTAGSDYKHEVGNTNYFAIATKFNEIATTVNNINQGMRRIEQKVNNLESRVTRLETTVRGLSARSIVNPSRTSSKE